MSDTTSVPGPVFGDKGYVMPTEAAILAGVQADLNAAFGGNLNPALDTPQGQIASSNAAIIGDANAQIAYLANQVDPAFASGRMQDAIGRIYFISRIPATATVVQATCSGLTGVVIPLGAMAQDTSGNLYIATASANIPLSGSVVVPFACASTGPIACPAGTLTTIYQSVPGWDSITNVSDGVMGNAVESRAAFEDRRRAAVAKNSVGSLSAIQGTVLEVSGVLDAYTYENYTGSPATVGGKTLAAHSLYVCVVGGADADVAKAIWLKKAPGCGYTGNTTVAVSDENSGYSVPYPSYDVTFQRPTSVTIQFGVKLLNSAAVPADVLDQVQTAILAAFAGADGGTRARIGSELFASRYYSAVASLGYWAQIISILFGRADAAATYSASISATTMTVASMTSGTLAAGQMIGGTDVLDGNYIVAQTSGTPGGAGVYTISKSNTLTSRTLTATDMLTTLQMNIDEVPVCAAPDISLTLV